MSQPRYIENQKAWLLPAPEHECEVLVGGDGGAPDSVRLALTETALRSLAELRDRATFYLDEFVDRRKFGPTSEWFLDGFKCGVVTNSADEFCLSFSLEGDTYGRWSVTFRCSEGQFSPIAFDRCQI